MADVLVRIAQKDVLVDFDLAVSMGAIDGVTHVHKFGLNEAVGTAFETIWSGSSPYVYLSAATVLNVSSADTDDTSAGAGAQQIKIEGLDGNYNPIEETVLMNGQTAVATGKAYLRIHRMGVIRGAANQGIIYAGTGGPTAGVPDTTYGCIEVGYGQTLQAFYTIMADHTGYLTSFEASSGVSKNLIARIMDREIGSVFQVKDILHLVEGEAVSEWKYPLKVPQKTDIEAQALASGGGGFLEATFTILLVKNN